MSKRSYSDSLLISSPRKRICCLQAKMLQKLNKDKTLLINSLNMDATQEYLKASRNGNLNRLVSILDTNDIDTNATNANGLSGLHLASKEGHALIVLELIRRGANLESQTKRGYTALHIASLAGQEEIVRLLLENGSRINSQSQTGFTALYMAAQENHPGVVQLLLENYADQTITTLDGYTPLAVALQLGHEDVVNLLMEFDTARGTSVSGTGGGGKGARLPALHAAAKKDDVPSAELLLRNAQNSDSTGRAVGNIVNDITKGGFTALHLAAHYGNVRVARLLLDYGADIDFKARNSITPLHVASKWGRTNMVQLLLENGARIDAQTRDELTPLHCAARSGNDQSVSTLISGGAPISARTKNGLAPLHMSAQGDHFESSKLLIRGGANVEDVTVDYLTPLHVTAHCGSVKVCKLLLDNTCDVDARALNGFTSLHVACKKNRIPIIELLLRYKATLEATTETGMTPLHVASFLGFKPIVELLLKEGADPNKKTTRGETALHLATRGDQNEVMECLLNNGAEVDAKANELQTPLHIAARQGNLDNVQLLLKHKASPNAATKDQYTPLHIAAREGHLDVARALLDKKADQSLTTKKGFSPLHIAAKQGHMPMTKLLLDRGGDPNVRGRNELTPLHVAAHYGHPEVALHLLDKGADPEAQAKNGYTPLHIAGKRNLVDIGRPLLKRGAKPNAESKNGFTPLHLATKEGHVPMVTELLDNGADANSRAKNGLTPMHLAAQEDHVPAAEILEENGAIIDPQTKAGYTPLHTACHFGQINMIQFLLRHGAQVNARTRAGYTPLHQAAQQGHVMALNALLKAGADPNAVTDGGHTGLSIADQLGYLSVVEMLAPITDAVPTAAARGTRYRPHAPETMREASMTDLDRHSPRTRSARSSRAMSDDSDNGPIDPDESLQQWPWNATTGPLPSHMNGSRGSYRDDGDLFGDRTSERYSAITPSMERRALEDELQYMREPVPAADDLTDSQYGGGVGTMTIPRAELLTPTPRITSNTMPKLHDHGHDEPIGCDLCQMEAAAAAGKSPGDRTGPTDGTAPNSGLAVSFVAGPEGGVGRGCPHSGIKVIVPPQSLDGPVRITCRLVEVERLDHPPNLMDGEALASRIVEMGPPGTKFDKPVLIEVPHFASLRGNERETLVLKSEDGKGWRDHTTASREEDVVNVLQALIDEPDQVVFEKSRVTRIVTTSFPQYFAIVSRLHEDRVPLTPQGGSIASSTYPGIVATYPPGALTKTTKLGVQVQPVPEELVQKKLGNKVSFSPIVSLEPRRRRFHKPVQLTLPAPAKSALKKRGSDPPKYRLLCSVAGPDSPIDAYSHTNPPIRYAEEAPAELEDITDSTPLTVSNDSVTFQTPLSARFWLIDCPNPGEAEKIASEIYPEVTRVPFMAKFVVFAKRHHPTAARIRVYCVLDDNVEHLLKNQGKFEEVARSPDVEVINGTPQYLEWDGNLLPVTRSPRKQQSVDFHSFKLNRTAFVVRIRDPKKDPQAKLLCMREPKTSGVTQRPITELTVRLPEVVHRERPSEREDDSGDEDIDLDELLRDDEGRKNGHPSNEDDEPIDELLIAQEAGPAAHSTPANRHKDKDSQQTKPLQTQQSNPYKDPTKYEPPSVIHPSELDTHDPGFKPKEDDSQVLRYEPQITTKTVEGEVQSKTKTDEDNQNLPDGRCVKRTVVTTEYIKPVTELTMKGDEVLSSKVNGIHIGTDIEEHILELPSGVIEPNAANCDTAITVENFEVPLPDGIVAKKKLVKMIVSLKEPKTPVKRPGDQAAEKEHPVGTAGEGRPDDDLSKGQQPLSQGQLPTDQSPRKSAEQPLRKIVEDDVVPREKVSEREEKLADGRTVRYKEVRTDYIKPITELLLVDGEVVDTIKREEVAGVVIEENVLELPVGMIEPNAANCETNIEVKTSNVPLPEGITAKKTTTKMTITINDNENTGLNAIPEVDDDDEPQRERGPLSDMFSSQPNPPPYPYFRKRDSKPNSTAPGSPGPKTPRTPLPEGGSRIIEGDIEYRTDTKEDEQTRNDGTTIRSKTISAKHFKPIFRVTKKNGVEDKVLVREEVVGADIVENILELPPGVREPNAENLVSNSVVQNVEEPLPGGVMARKKIVKTVVSFKDLPSTKTAHAAGKPLPTPVRKTVESPPEDKVLEKEDSDTLPDGVVVCKKEVTIRHVVPITEIVIANGRLPESSERERVLGMDITENILIVPCGIIKPHAQNCQSDIAVVKSKTVSPDGLEINRKLVKVDVQLQHPPITHKVVDGTPFSKQEVVENKHTLPDKRISRQKVVTTRHIQPITEIQVEDGKVTETRPKEELTEVEIDENIIELPVGVIEPNARNCDTIVTVDASHITLPEGVKAKKTTVKAMVVLKDEPSESTGIGAGAGSQGPAGAGALGPGVQSPGAASLSPRSPTGAHPNSSSTSSVPVGSPTTDGAAKKLQDMKPMKDGEKRIVEGDIEYKKESQNNEYRDREGKIIRIKTDTNKHMRPIYEVTRTKGVDRKKLIREELVGADIVENVLELPQGVNQPNGENLRAVTTVKNVEERLPDGVVADKKIVRTVVTKINPLLPVGPPVSKSPSGVEKPLIIKNLVEGPIKIKTAENEHVQNQPDGVSLLDKKVTLTHVVPVTEAVIENFAPPDSKSWDKVVGGDVVEARMRLTSGTIEQNGENCKTNLVVDQKPDKVSLDDGTPANVKVIKMNVDIEPPTHSQLKTHKITEGETKAKSDVFEDEKYLADGSTVKHKIITTKYFKPITDDTVLEGMVIDSHSWEEIVEASIDENILILPVGVIEPHASNVDLDIDIETQDVPIPEGIMAKKTIVKITARLKDKDHPENAGEPEGSDRDTLHDKKQKDKDKKKDKEKDKGKKPENNITTIDPKKLEELPTIRDHKSIKDPESHLVHGPIDSRSTSKEDQKKMSDGGIRRTKTVTTNNIQPVYKIGLIKGIEYKALVKEEVKDVIITENILEIPKGISEPFDKNVKIDTTVNETEEKLKDGTPVKKKTLKSTVTPMIEEKTKFLPEHQPVDPATKRLSYTGPEEDQPNVKVFEGAPEPRQTVVEDQETLPNGTTIKRKEVTTRMVKPVTEVKLIPGKPPDSVTKDVVIGATVEEVFLRLPAGVLEPNAANCETDIKVTKSNTVLPDGTPAKKKVIEMVVKIKEPEITHSLVEGEIVSKSDTQEEEKTLSDGSTLKRKVITTQNWKPVTDIVLTNGIFTSEKTEEKLVSVNVEENLIRLPVGVIQPHASNCDTQISVNTSDITNAEGVPGKKKMVKVLVKLKGQPSDNTNAIFENAVREITGEPSTGIVPETPSRVEDGAVVFRTETDSDEKILHDGTTIRTKRAITRHVKPTIKITFTDGVEKKTLLREEIVGADIEENILELPSGVAEPDGYKLDTSISNTQERLPDGTLAKKKIIHSVVLIPGQSPVRHVDNKPRLTPTKMDKSDPPSTGTKVIEGDTEPKSTVEEDCKQLPNGRTLKRKTITTRFVRPVTEIKFSKGVPVETKKKEEIVGTEIEENLLELPVGVLEPEAKNCDTIITVENSEVVMPDGLPAQKRVVKMDIRLKVPDTDKKLIEGDIIPKVDEKEDQQVFDDGSTCRKKIITTKFIKPVKEIVLVNGVESEEHVREELVGMEIEEVTLRMPAGIIEPYGSNLDTKTNVDQVDVQMPDGIVAKKKIVQIDVKLKQPLVPEVEHKLVEGEATCENDVKNHDETLQDGTRVKRHIVTTRHFIPVTDITVVNGVEKEKKVTNKLTGIEVEETILKLCPGVTNPDASNVQKETREKTVTDVLPDGNLAKKKIIKTVARLKQEPTSEPLMVGVTRKSQTTSDFDDEVTRTRFERDRKIGRFPEDGSNEGGDEGSGGFGSSTTVTRTTRTETSESRSGRDDGGRGRGGKKPLGGKRRVKKMMRRIDSLGNIFEEAFSDEEELSDPNNEDEEATPFWLRLSGDDSDTEIPEALKLFTTTEEEEPVVDRQVAEYEDMLPDGTLVSRRITTTTMTGTITKRIIIEDPEDQSADKTFDNASLTRYTDLNQFEPDPKDDLEESEEPLHDGRTMRKRIKTKLQHKLTAERRILCGKLEDLPYKDMLAKASNGGSDFSASKTGHGKDSSRLRYL